MTTEQIKMLEEVHQMLTELKTEYKEFKSSTGFNPTNEIGCP